MKLKIAQSVFILLLFVAYAFGQAEYDDGEPVSIWINKIGPYHNPTETYSYSHLPYCKPEPLKPERMWGGIGAILEGNEWENSGIKIFYKQNIATPTGLCQIPKLSEDDAQIFMHAISNHYWYQLFIDNLPLWGMVGELVLPDEEKAKLELDKVNEHAIMPDASYIFTHKAFNISYNGKNIIHVNITSDNLQKVVAGSLYNFTYSVVWTETDILYKDRYQKYLDYGFFEHQIHWFSIFNSLMMVLFLCGVVAIILIRTLQKDIARYSLDDDNISLLSPGIDDSGWKQVHADVFRAPSHLSLYCACYGSGMQLIWVMFIVIFMAICSSNVYQPGTITSFFIYSLIATAFINGYLSGSRYKSFFSPLPSPNWKATLILSSSLFPCTCFLVGFLLNFIAIYYDTMNTIPFSTMMKLFMLWLFGYIPLVVVGTIFGRSWSGVVDIPCKVNAIPRPIPQKNCLVKPRTIILLSGILPFGSIFIEIFFIFSAFWSYKFYFVYGFMLLVFSILCIVNISVTIVGVYILLNAENYQWQWTSFLSAASTAIYVFFYCIYFFFFKTKMSGLLQLAYYYGYCFLFCFGLSLMCGAIGNWGATIFVRRIYSSVKVD